MRESDIDQGRANLVEIQARDFLDSLALNLLYPFN